MNIQLFRELDIEIDRSLSLERTDSSRSILTFQLSIKAVARMQQQVNPLLPKRYFCASIQFIVFKKQLLQGANTDLFFNPSVPKAHDSERQNVIISLQIKPVKSVEADRAYCRYDTLTTELKLYSFRLDLVGGLLFFYISALKG